MKPPILRRIRSTWTRKSLPTACAAKVFAYVWQDGPNVFYPDHQHDEETAHIILAGEMTLLLDGQARTYRSGDRCDVPAHSTHSARMGPRGCRYLIGER